MYFYKVLRTSCLISQLTYGYHTKKYFHGKCIMQYRNQNISIETKYAKLFNILHLSF